MNDKLFDSKEFSVKPIPKSLCVPYIKYRHYLKAISVNILYAFGLFHDAKLCGIITYGNPPSPTCTVICGDQYRNIVIELNRLIVDESVPKNGESFLISQSLKLIDKPKIVISYADESKSHVGCIYQASNFIYTGFSDCKTSQYIVDGKRLSRRTITSKIKDPNDDHLKEIYGDRIVFLEPKPKHRYVYFLGTKKQKKEMLSCLKHKILPYPKGNVEKYEVGKTPLEMFLE